MAHDRGEEEKSKGDLTAEKDVIFFGHGFRLVILRQGQRRDRPISEENTLSALLAQLGRVTYKALK